jgi:DNA-binding transcriptional MerR regulator/DNA gyrase inhibitor GyrI
VYDLKKIGEMAKIFNVSTRTVRYYEKMGLLKIFRDPDSKYRLYDEEAADRLKQILMLRELGLSLNEIKVILENKDIAEITEIFSINLLKIQEEIKRHLVLEDVMQKLLSMIDDDRNFTDVMDNLDRLSSDGLENFEEEYKMEKLTNSNVRIIKMKPTKVAACRVASESPELDSLNVLMEWAKREGIMDLTTTRVFGFDIAHPKEELPVYGYETWLTVPDDCKIPESMMGKYLQGGLYAVTNTTYGNFDVQKRWKMLSEWFQESEFEYGSGQCLEEILMIENFDPSKLQLDLFIHIKEV